jgi:phytoene dehydrogenase-like protein
MESYIVVGGGLAGLTAANALAASEVRVTLLEQSSHLGGRARTQDESGYLFNLGPHALFLGGTAARTLREWNISFSGGIPGSGGNGFFVRGEQFYPLVTTLGGLLKSRLFNVREKPQAANVLRLLAAAKAKPGETMDAWLDRNTFAPRVREFAATAIRISTYAIDLQHLDARAALRQIALGLKHSVLYLNGGWQTLVEGLAQRARSLGVDIHYGESVASAESLLAEHNTTGVILAVGPKQVEKLTGMNMDGHANQPVYMASLDLGLRGMLANTPDLAFALDRPLYFSAHSAYAQLAPKEGRMVHVAKYLGNTRQDAKAVRAELEEYATLVMPGWRRGVAFERFLPELLVTPAMPTNAGRPDVDALSMKGIAIAGDWVGPEGMLADAAVASALRAANLLRQQRAAAA